MILVEHFLKEFIYCIYQFHVSLNLIFDVNLYNGILMFPLTFPVTCGGLHKKSKMTS